MSQSRDQLLLALSRIPAGKVISYGALAAMAGHPGAARWVGQVLSQLPSNTRLPWHRVVNAEGRIYLSHERGQVQKRLLELESVRFNNDRIAMSEFSWQP